MMAYSASPSRLPINTIQNPFTYSINPQLSDSLQPYNFHEHSLGNSPPQQRGPNNPRREANFTENLNLMDNQSFARNFKSRLYGADPTEEVAKQLKQQKYREELLFQAEENRRKKQMQKAKADAEDEKLEREFYQNIKIQAQKKAIKKEEPSYFMMRTAKGRLNKSLNLSRSKDLEVDNSELEPKNSRVEVLGEFSRKDNLKRTFHQHPTIMKRGGYHNQSSLDPRVAAANPEDPNDIEIPQPQMQRAAPKLSQSLKYRQDSLEQQLKYEQNRMNQILLFQQHMLKKIDYFKKEVINTSRSLMLEEELDKVKIKLRAKPLNMAKVYSLNPREGLDNMMENTSFYHLPLISPSHGKVIEGSREVKKRKEKDRDLRHLKSSESDELNQEEMGKEVIRLEDKRKNGYNDKNILSNFEKSDISIQADES